MRLFPSARQSLAILFHSLLWTGCFAFQCGPALSLSLSLSLSFFSLNGHSSSSATTRSHTRTSREEKNPLFLLSPLSFEISTDQRRRRLWWSRLSNFSQEFLFPLMSPINGCCCRVYGANPLLHGLSAKVERVVASPSLRSCCVHQRGQSSPLFLSRERSC